MTALPLPGPEKVDCPDGCGLFGKPLKSRRGHVRGCKCKPCVAGRNSQSGKARHRKFARDLGIINGKFSTSTEEVWGGPFRWEVKSGKQIEPILTRYEAARDQSDAARAVGDPRPFAMGVVPTESARRSLVLIDAEVWVEVIAPLLEALL